ncbi:MAG: prenyltransferase [Gallionellaceae bacterium]
MTTQPMEPTLALYTHPGKRYFAATRPAFISATLVAAIIGLSVIHHEGVAIDFIVALVTLFFALVTHAGVNVLNDYYDALSGTDGRNTERIYPFTGGSRFIQNGVLTLAQTRNFGYTLLASVVIAGLWLMAHSAPQLLYIGLLGLFIGWAYSAPPLKLVSRGWGELCVASGILLITVGADFVLRKSFSFAPVIAGMPYALLATNLLYINQFPDRKADTAAGKLHWVARLEVRQARWGYVLFAVAAYLWVAVAVALRALPQLALVSLLAAPFSVMATLHLFRYAHQPQQLAGAIKLTILAMLLHGALMSAVFIL